MGAATTLSSAQHSMASPRTHNTNHMRRSRSAAGAGPGPASAVATTTTTIASSTTRPTAPSSMLQPQPTERTVLNVVLGDVLFKTWYGSFYPPEIVGRGSAAAAATVPTTNISSPSVNGVSEGSGAGTVAAKGVTERLYVCRWCFKYSKELMPYLGHVRSCPLRAEPPGHRIYSKGPYSIREVDGETHKLFAQNLSLFAKLFLDNKSVFFDVSSFLYYILCYTPPTTGDSGIGPADGEGEEQQIIGFFSKEKMSWDNNNLACILVFPPYQRKGLGKILMGLSYELGRREGRFGGPEKPLSELGVKGYLSFWSATVARYILGIAPTTTTTITTTTTTTSSKKRTFSSSTSNSNNYLTVKDISAATYLLPEDIIAALKWMGVLSPLNAPASGTAKTADDGAADMAALVVDKNTIRDWALKHSIDLAPPVDPEMLVLRESVITIGEGEEEEEEEEGEDEDEEEEEDEDG
ncbi:MAG: hypothetical protein M1819_006773 [Sarea resinae]|nr:MAG: hypothetical protein M1819_006773 [Sarea resinae]